MNLDDLILNYLHWADNDRARLLCCTDTVKSLNLLDMIISFGDKTTSDVFNGISNARVRRLPFQIIEQAIIKLDLINAAYNLNDLRSPPGNRLEQLSGNLKGFHSIRINNQWRLIFRWNANNAYDVQIVDYH